MIALHGKISASAVLGKKEAGILATGTKSDSPEVAVDEVKEKGMATEEDFSKMEYGTHNEECAASNLQYGGMKKGGEQLLWWWAVNLLSGPDIADKRRPTGLLKISEGSNPPSSTS
ncbi:hypothetical protein Ancab_021502 [Ancistrocladus abbreviatus]